MSLGKLCLTESMETSACACPLYDRIPGVCPSCLGADTGAALNRDTGTLFNRSVFVDCRKQMIDVIKYEGIGAVGPAFGALGEVAARP